MKMMKLTQRTIAVLVLGLAFAAPALAQPSGGGPGNPTPIGFIEILVGAGAILGGKKAFDRKRK